MDVEKYKDIYQNLDLLDLINLCEHLYKSNDKNDSLKKEASKLLKIYKTRSINQSLEIKTLRKKLKAKQKTIHEKIKIVHVNENKQIKGLQKQIGLKDSEINFLKRKMHMGNYENQCTNKVRYGSDIEATMALGSIKKAPNRKKNYPNRMYKCTFCKGFHLTSKNKK